MKTTRKASLALALAILEGLAITASAQIAAPGQDGRAMDANNRVGSGGYNDSGNTRPGVTPNQIIYGNVTGGKGFSGPVGETDSGEFFGPKAGRMADRFISGSSGVPQAYQPQADLSVSQPFFGSSRGAPAPLGTVRDGFTGAYLGTPLMSDMSGYEYADQQDQLEQRLGQPTILGTRSTFLGSQSGEAYLQGPLGMDNQQTSLSGSALYGIQPLRSTINSLDDNTPGQSPGSAGLLAGPGDRFRFDSTELRQMRSELQSPLEQQGPQNDSPTNPGRQGLGQSFDSQSSAAQTSNGLNNQALSNDLQINQPTQRRYTIVSPELQSEQYRELRQRQAQYENPQFAQMQAQHMARLQKQAIAAKLAGGATSRPAPTIGAGAMLLQPGLGSINAPAPMKITSLATGIRAKGLHDMLASAEDLMRQGKFQSAIERYDVALQIAPNNPLVPLGRANAELGAGAYRQASSDLHRVFASDHATLLAKYDLKGWFPTDRFEAVTKELGELSAKDPKDEMPEFLLAYMSYNVGDTAQATHHLAEARKRAGDQDPVLDLLDREWKLSPSEEPPAPAHAPTDLNK